MLRTNRLMMMGLVTGTLLAWNSAEVVAQCSRGGRGAPGATSIASSPLAFASMSSVGVRRSDSADLLALRNRASQQAQRQRVAMRQQQSFRRAQQERDLLAARRRRAEATRAKRAERIAANKAKYNAGQSPGEFTVSDAMFAASSDRELDTETLTSLISRNPFER